MPTKWIWPKDSTSWIARANIAAPEPKRLFLLIQCISNLAATYDIIWGPKSKSAPQVKW
jgi:hypothetical protein